MGSCDLEVEPIRIYQTISEVAFSKTERARAKFALALSVQHPTQQLLHAIAQIRTRTAQPAAWACRTAGGPPLRALRPAGPSQQARPRTRTVPCHPSTARWPTVPPGPPRPRR